MRHSLQFHWRNQGYETFSDYLEALSGKRRRQILRERRQLEDGDLEISHLTGDALLPEHAESMYEFYLATLDGKWGVPYLNRAFFDEVFRTMKDRTLLVLARDRASSPVAGALFFLKDSSLFGRYWGAARQGATCTSNCATTRLSTSPSSGASNSWRPAPRASTSWREASSSLSPTAPIR